MTLTEALTFIERHGVVCESARRDAIYSLADAIAGAAIRGNWWSHPKSREIFAITRAVRDAPGVLVCRIVDAKITYVHERLWPALVRLADTFPAERLARVREVHGPGGKHTLEEIPFPEWIPEDVGRSARRLSEAKARSELSVLLAKDR